MAEVSGVYFEEESFYELDLSLHVRLQIVPVFRWLKMFASARRKQKTTKESLSTGKAY